ncbi:MAG: WYL domain-containing protein [Alphaproteobacteria bacterium]|nr:WYL domain-containing protein [Alphaproteobacteria bacterium]
MAKRETRRWSVEKRLEFIDFRLFWEGQINRSDIMERFGVSVPQASTDLSLYQEAAPQNLMYDPRGKKYLASPSFKPHFFKADSDSYLWQLRDDVRDFSESGTAWLSSLPEHDIFRLPHRNISPQILKEVLSTIREKKALEIFYQSMTSNDPSWRKISPHALAFDGHRWHVRAFCHRNKFFKDFLLSRIQKTGDVSADSVSGTQDKIWHEIFTVKLKPHPKLSKSQTKAVAQDYDMRDGKLDVQIRLALLYYFLRRLNLEDCDGEKRNTREQHVVIANKVETQKALDKAQYKDVLQS